MAQGITCGIGPPCDYITADGKCTYCFGCQHQRPLSTVYAPFQLKMPEQGVAGPLMEEVKISGCCQHHVPFGRSCKECGRIVVSEME